MFSEMISRKNILLAFHSRKHITFPYHSPYHIWIWRICFAIWLSLFLIELSMHTRHLSSTYMRKRSFQNNTSANEFPHFLKNLINHKINAIGTLTGNFLLHFWKFSRTTDFCEVYPINSKISKYILHTYI